MRAFVGLVAALVLGGCDAYPTVVSNLTGNPIKLQYRASGHPEWSATYEVGASTTQRLAREHWVQDILGLRVEESGKAYELSFAQLKPVRDGCRSNVLARTFKLALDCYVDYLGQGRLRGSLVEPRGN